MLGQVHVGHVRSDGAQATRGAPETLVVVVVEGAVVRVGIIVQRVQLRLGRQGEDRGPVDTAPLLLLTAHLLLLEAAAAHTKRRRRRWNRRLTKRRVKVFEWRIKAAADHIVVAAGETAATASGLAAASTLPVGIWRRRCHKTCEAAHLVGPVGLLLLLLLLLGHLLLMMKTAVVVVVVGELLGSSSGRRLLLFALFRG